MKTLRANITLLLVSVSVALPVAAPLVQAYLFEPAVSPTLFRILQIVQQSLALAPGNSQRKQRKNAA